MQEFWNERYQREEYIYGKDPNEYLKAQLKNLTPGRILFPAEGEGRNAVHAAKKGWQVSAFDQSEEGRKKALRLAEAEGVEIDYTV
ncbi:MAG: SAM-dependent methyltransferase, partial [Salinimicrobium sediminis]|nr:SAM-dependent methyltransferase [Salinimicrobium sediminis]